jgi:putative transposase
MAVILRGIEQRPIFRSNADRINFVERCGSLFPDAGVVCSAWALLPNHVHLLLRTGAVPLSRRYSIEPIFK